MPGSWDPNPQGIDRVHDNRLPDTIITLAARIWLHGGESGTTIQGYLLKNILELIKKTSFTKGIEYARMTKGY